MERNNKHKIQRMKKLSKEEITRVDFRSFYVPSSDPDMKGEPYFVYMDQTERWLCDCMNFVLNLKDKNDAPTHKCKHIKHVISSYFKHDPRFTNDVASRTSS